MGWEKRTGRFGRIIGIVIAEYALFVLALFLIIRFFSPGAVQVASVAAILFGLLTIFNFMFAYRSFSGRFPPALARHLFLLRDDFLYLRWYFDEILETMSSAVIVLDRLLTVRSMNHAGRNLLSLGEKEELVGRPFRFHPLSKEIYSGEMYSYRGKPLVDVFEACASEGTSILLEQVRYRKREKEEPVSLNLLIYPWKNRQDETERLVIRVDEAGRNGREAEEIDLEKLLAATPPPSRRLPPDPALSSPTLLDDFGAVQDHLQALLSSARSIGQVLEPDEKGAQAELLLFEMQVKRILDMIGRMENEIGKGSR